MLDFKMFVIKLNLVLFLFFESFCMRRTEKITRSMKINVTTDHPYVVYLIKSAKATQLYDEWLCGGALVSSSFILTSAACVEDIDYTYAIAGYKKYVPDEDFNKDNCIINKKKKVVYACMPLKYEYKYDQLEKWSFVDIALVKVESAYDFSDATYETDCSYIPKIIKINYWSKNQDTGRDVAVFGWGHLTAWRKPDDHNNYNQKELKYAPTMIMNKEDCKLHYEVYPEMNKVIDESMICTFLKGELMDTGAPVKNITLLRAQSSKKRGGNKIFSNGCLNNLTYHFERSSLLNTVLCEDGNTNDIAYQDMLADATRREANKSNQTNLIEILNRTAILNGTLNMNTRRQGFCQNDHGGPLITWMGTEPVVIGVASVFKVSEQSECIGPFLYVSTYCNGAFLNCVLNPADTNTTRRALCDSAPVMRGYDIVEKYISWDTNHTR